MSDSGTYSLFVRVIFRLSILTMCFVHHRFAASLIVALYRLAELSAGTIEVNSVDCSTVSLNTLRSRMAIIPQEPVMFGGTIRANLDPFNQRTDEELLDVLYKSVATGVGS